MERQQAHPRSIWGVRALRNVADLSRSSPPCHPSPLFLQGGIHIACGQPDAICILTNGVPECRRPDVQAMPMGVAAMPEALGGGGMTSIGTAGVAAIPEGLAGGTIGGMTLPSLTSLLGE